MTGLGAATPREPIGRAVACAELSAALAEAEAERAATVSVVGEAGSGKTMLLDWLRREAHGRFTVVPVRPVEGEEGLPLGVMVDVVRPLAAHLPQLGGDQRGVLTAAAGGIGAVSSDPLLLPVATLSLLAAAAEERPVLLIVDDAHWMDPASARALSFAARKLLADRVACVVARRPVEADPVPGLARLLTLTGLSEDEVSELLASVAGVRAAGGVAHRVLAETGGNPLAVSHLARALGAAGVGGSTRLPDDLPLAAAARRTFTGLVEALAEPTREALALVAVAGSAPEVVGEGLAATGGSVADLLPAEEAGLLLLAGGRIEFAHPLYRAAALEVAGPAGTRRAHAVVSRVVPDPARAAWHRGLSCIGVDEEAAAALDDAAAGAEEQRGPAATVGLRELAIRLSGDPTARARRRFAAARALVAAGHHAQAREYLQAVLEATPGDHELHAEALGELARLALWDTPLDSQLIDGIPADLPPRIRSAVLAVAALRARNAGEFDRFHDTAVAAHTAVPVGTGVAGDLAALPTLSLVAESEIIRGHHRAPVIDDLVASVRRLLAAARGDGPEAAEIGRGLVALLDGLAGSPGQTLIWTPALGLADELLAVWLRAARARPASVTYLLMARTELTGWTGQYQAGLATGDRAIELAREVGSLALAGWAHVFAARIHALVGDERGCDAHAEAATELGTELAQPGLPVWGLHARARSRLASERFAEAAELMAPVAGFAEYVGCQGTRILPWQPDLVEALARGGRHTEAEELLGRWRATSPADPDDWHRALMGAAALHTGDNTGLPELETLLAAGSLAATPLDEARARLAVGVAHRRGRRPKAARAAFDEALTAFTRLHAPGWAARVQAEYGAGRTTGAPAAEDTAGLTAQELRVAQEISGGATYGEAAAELHCSARTVEYHLSNIYAKLGIRSRRQLTRELLGRATGVIPLAR